MTIDENYIEERHRAILARFEAKVRGRLKRNGRNPENANAGIPVDSDLHMMEVFLNEIERLRAMLKIDQLSPDTFNTTN